MASVTYYVITDECNNKPNLMVHNGDLMIKQGRDARMTRGHDAPMTRRPELFDERTLWLL